jgi:5-oxoprolinase (ATP-hydrolysing)
VWDAGEWREARIVERSSLRAGETVEGPAVIAEAGATTYVPVRNSAAPAADGSLRIGVRP